MPGLKRHFPDFTFAANQVGSDEMDVYEQYQIINPSISATYVGTAAGGTASVAKPLVIISARPDYPRNLLYSAVGTNDAGGTWIVNGKDQFGSVIQETVTSGTVAAGTPAFAIAGTKIFAQVTSGTFTATSTTVGLGSARLGLAIGTAAGAKTYLGLPVKIGAVTDVKALTWSSQSVGTVINGGTIDSTVVSTTNHSIAPVSVMAGTEVYSVLVKSTYNSQSEPNNAGL